MDVNVWGPVPGETITSTVWSVRNWAVAASVSNPDGGVTCFPNTAAYPVSVPVEHLGLLHLRVE